MPEETPEDPVVAPPVKQLSPATAASAQRPHWTTFVAPTASVLVSGIALWTTLITQRDSRLVQRPFVSVSFEQKRPGNLARNGDGKPPMALADGILTVKNTGNSPAFGVDFRIDDKKMTCGTVKPFDIAAHDQFVMNPEDCWEKPALKWNPATIMTVYVGGSIKYRDSSGTHYDEPITVPINLGGDKVWKNRIE
jgi:hypothetical protein